MKTRILLAAVVMASFVGTAQAQFVINHFETAAADSIFNLYGTGLNAELGGKAFMELSDDPSDPFEGDAALKCEWGVHTTESWGGFLQLQYLQPDTLPLFDFSTAEYISIMFNNHQPCNKPGKVTMRFKVHDAGDGRGAAVEDWYFETSVVYDNTTTGWQELLIPLREVQDPVGAIPNDQGFSLPGWSGNTNGNQKMDLNKVAGYSIEWPAALIEDDSTANGVISWDFLRLKGHRNPVLYLFESASEDTSISFAGTGSSSITITENATLGFEDNAAQLDWFVDATESWGGYASITVSSDTFYADMLGHTHISLMYNNLVAQSNPGEVTLRVELHDYSEGEDQQEVWYYATSNVLDAEAGWNTLLLPLEDLGMGTFPSDQGFSNPGWAGVPGNSKLDFDKIGGFVIEFSAATQGTQTSGTLLLDNMELYGERPTDTEGPVAVQNLAAVPGDFINIITWDDVPGEVGESYDIFYSDAPITDVDAVEVVALKVAENTRVSEHRLLYPVTDTEVTYYYAIRAKDKVGNLGAVTMLPSPLSNIAKGVVTVSLEAPANFAADGDLAEWSHITPFRMFPSEGAPIVTNTTVDNDADLSVLAYVAVDNDFLYVAFDVTDDVTSPDIVPESWLNDSPDLFIGLYDWRGAPHLGYERGETPDYHFRFNKGSMIEDHLGGATVLTADSADYFWGEKFVNGYIVETRISLSRLAEIGGDELFSPVEGFRIPIDFSVNDADGAAREGIMTFSPNNQDLSWQTPSRWTHTWLGNLEKPVSVDDGAIEVPFTYHLSQNYPNPFNPVTTIQYAVEKPGLVNVAIFNVLGQKVRTLVDEHKPAGEYSIRFEAAGLSSGVYFYKIQSGDFVQTKKMVIMR